MSIFFDLWGVDWPCQIFRTIASCACSFGSLDSSGTRARRKRLSPNFRFVTGRVGWSTSPSGWATGSQRCFSCFSSFASLMNWSFRRRRLTPWSPPFPRSSMWGARMSTLRIQAAISWTLWASCLYFCFREGAKCFSQASLFISQNNIKQLRTGLPHFWETSSEPHQHVCGYPSRDPSGATDVQEQRHDAWLLKQDMRELQQDDVN